jgi:hypothetical protein
VAGVNPIQLQKYLRGINYPAAKQDLVKKAEQEGADRNVMAALQALPDKTYDGPDDVSEAIGKND